MKTQDTKKWRSVAISVAVLSAILLPLVGQAGPVGKCVQVSTRPLSDFLDAQGSTFMFFPPVRDMLGWNDGITFGLVDYAGFASAYIEAATGTSLGTRVHGRVVECARADSTALISSTQNALGFAQSVEALIENNFDFLNTPTIFGAKAQDVVGGAEPALGTAQFRTTFVIGQPGDPIPDIRIAFQENVPDVRPITLDFKSTTVGTLPDGTRARLRIHQVGATDEAGNLVFTRELTEVVSGH